MRELAIITRERVRELAINTHRELAINTRVRELAWLAIIVKVGWILMCTRKSWYLNGLNTWGHNVSRCNLWAGLGMAVKKEAQNTRIYCVLNNFLSPFFFLLFFDKFFVK